MRKKKKNSGYSLSVNLLDSFNKLKKVNSAIPTCDFDCGNCKDNCCVSPYISVVEFLYVAAHIIRNFENSYEVLLRDNGRNGDGHKICPFLDNDECLIYKARHYKCRITGMDILDDIFADVCQHKKDVGIKSPEITKEEWLRWINVLTKINKPFNYTEQLQFDEWIQFCFKEVDQLNINEIRVQSFLNNYLQLKEKIPIFTVDDL